jgi:hypothetical protein
MSGREHPRPFGQLRRHVEDGLAVSHQPLSQVPADSVAALHRPDPIRPPAGHGQHPPVAVPVGAEPAAAEDRLPIVEDLDRRRQLVRIHSDDDAAHAALLASCRLLDRRGGQRFFEQNRPFSSHNPAAVPGQDARQKRATPTHGGQPH